MEANGEVEHLARNNIDSASFSADRGAQISDAVAATAQRGGWITVPFIAGTVMGTQLCNGGWSGNLIVYLIEEFNVTSIKAANIGNVSNGCALFFPLLGGIIADSFGSLIVISTSTFISLLGMTLLTLTASFDSLRPQHCEIGSSFCETPSKSQFAVLYASIALLCIGLGGTYFTVASMGAKQLDKAQDQAVFFTWFFIAQYGSAVISNTVLIYVEDNVSWRFGFGLCIAAGFAASAIFLLGKRFYRHDKPQGSPFLAFARVIVATVRKWKVVLSSRSEDYYQKHNAMTTVVPATLTQKFRFLNRAALKIEGDIREDGSIAKPWRLCSVQQVEDLKAIIRIFPIWSTSLIVGITIAIQNSMAVLQALTMDRHLGSHFKIPTGSIGVISFTSSFIFLPFIDRLLSPLWQKLTRRSLTPLQKMGAGHVANMIGLTVAALIESKRLKIVHAHRLENQPGSIVPMLAVWIFPQLVLAGITEAFWTPGQLSLYHREFPVSLRSTSAGMISLIVGIGFYLSTALTKTIRNVTTWLPDNINNGRLDNVYWTLLVLVALNFGYYLVCSWIYKYQYAGRGEDDSFGSATPS